MMNRKRELFALDFSHGVQSAVHPVTPGQLKPAAGMEGGMRTVGRDPGRLDGVKHR